MLKRDGFIVGQARSGSVDSQNAPTLAAAPQVPVRYYQEQLSASEVADDRDAQLGDHRLILPPGTAVDGSDSFLGDDGVTYQFIGPPAHRYDPDAGGEHHVDAIIREASG